MKFVLCVLVFLFCSSQSMASNVSVNVNGEVYSCSADGSSVDGCSSKASSLKKRLSLCNKEQGVAWCIQTMWPKFKDANGSCVEEGSEVCMDVCVNGNNPQGAAWCSQGCQ